MLFYSALRNVQEWLREVHHLFWAMATLGRKCVDELKRKLLQFTSANLSTTSKEFFPNEVSREEEEKTSTCNNEKIDADKDNKKNHCAYEEKNECVPSYELREEEEKNSCNVEKKNAEKDAKTEFRVESQGFRNVEKSEHENLHKFNT